MLRQQAVHLFGLRRAVIADAHCLHLEVWTIPPHHNQRAAQAALAWPLLAELGATAPCEAAGRRQLQSLSAHQTQVHCLLKPCCQDVLRVRWEREVDLHGVTDRFLHKRNRASTPSHVRLGDCQQLPFGQRDALLHSRDPRSCPRGVLRGA